MESQTSWIVCDSRGQDGPEIPCPYISMACSKSCKHGKDPMRKCKWNNIVIREAPSVDIRPQKTHSESLPKVKPQVTRYKSSLKLAPLAEIQTLSYELKTSSRTCKDISQEARLETACKSITETLVGLRLLGLKSTLDKNCLI